MPVTSQPALVNPQPINAQTRAAQRLWKLWQTGEQPELQDFLAQAGALTPDELVAVLRVDQRQRWSSGDRVAVESYLEIATALPRNSSHVLDLAYSEFLLREELGEFPEPAEYVRRFPQFANELNLQVELHRALASPSCSPPADRSATHAFPATRPHAPDGPTVVPEIPGYELLEKLGEGGMGVVYKARQEGLNRFVALKMIRGSADLDAEQRKRFRAEAEAVARFAHPHIVQIYQVGEQQERPYFSLEYVEGGSLEARFGGMPQPTGQAAQLVMTLARAIQAAHERGIIHRDLKPANILLTAQGVPKITDFGLAKQLDTAVGQTKSGAIMGTPCYMAPEQAHGKGAAIGPATDVYSLGAILYELLTGRSPFKAATVLETLDQVRNASPVPPGRLRPGLPRDLDTICLKCLEKEPQKRYPSAAALADDLHRFILDKPIRARPVGPLEHLARWSRRKPLVASLLAAVLLVGAVGLGAVFWQWRRAEYNFTVAQGQQAEAETQRDQARRDFRLANEAVDRFCTQVSLNRLLNEPHMEGLRKELLQSAVGFYEKFAEQHASDPELQLERAAAYRRLADITGAVGKPQDAINHCRQAIAILESIPPGGDQERKRLRELSDAQNRLGVILWKSSGPAQAEAYLRQALQIVEDLYQQSPDDLDLENRVSELLQNLAPLERETGRSRDAERHSLEAVRIQERLSQRFGTHEEVRVGFAVAVMHLGKFYAETGQFDRAEGPLRRAVDLLSAVAQGHVDQMHQYVLAGAQLNLCDIYHKLERLDLAEKHARAALEICTNLAAAHPAVNEYQEAVTKSLAELSVILAAQGHRREAIQHGSRAQKGFEKLAQAHPDVAAYQHSVAVNCRNLGAWHWELGELEPAAHVWQRAAAIWEKLAQDCPTVVDYPWSLAELYGNCAWLYSQMGRRDQLRQATMQAVEILKRLTKEHPDNAHYSYELANTTGYLGCYYLDQGNLPLGEQNLMQAVELWTKTNAAHPADDREQAIYANCLVFVARLHAVKGRTAEAEAKVAIAIREAERLLPRRPKDTNLRSNLGFAYNLQGQLLRNAGRWQPALTVLRRAVTFQEAVVKENPAPGSNQVRLALAYSDLAGMLLAQNLFPEAEKFYRLELPLGEQVLERDPSDWVRVMVGGDYCNLGGILTTLGKPRESLALLDRATAHLARVSAADLIGQQARFNEQNVRINRAMTYTALGEHELAVREWGRALDAGPVAAKPTPQEQARRQYMHVSRAQNLAVLRRFAEAVRDLDAGMRDSAQYWALRAYRAALVAYMGHHSQALSEAGILHILPTLPAQSLYGLAEVYALGLSHLEHDASLADGLRRDKVKEYVGRALDLLNRAQTAPGAASIQLLSRLKMAPSLAALRSREEFKELTARVERAQKSLNR